MKTLLLLPLLLFSHTLFASQFDSELLSLKNLSDELRFEIAESGKRFEGSDYLKFSSESLFKEIDLLKEEMDKEENEERNEEESNQNKNIIITRISHIETILERVSIDLDLYAPRPRSIELTLQMEQTLNLINSKIEQESNDELQLVKNLSAKELKFKTASEACHALALPGDILLRKALLTEGTTDDDFGPRTMALIKGLETLKGQDTKLTYRHSELIIDLPHYNNITTLSYYPWQFNYGKPKEDKMPLFLEINNKYPEYTSYRSKFTIFKVNGRNEKKEIKRRERALEKASHKENFLTLGTCADFVNWTYGGTIRSNWNRIPVLKQAIALLYFPEGIDTPDDLADSYMTDKICDVENSQLLYPRQVNLLSWMNRLLEAKSSTNDKIRGHALEIIELLKKRGALDKDEKITSDLVNLTVSRF